MSADLLNTPGPSGPLTTLHHPPHSSTPAPPSSSNPPPQNPSVNLSNFSTFDFPLGSHPYLTSPRSIEVCKLAGVTVDDLVPHPMSHYLNMVRDDPTIKECVATKVEDVARLRMERGRSAGGSLLGSWGRRGIGSS